MRILIVENQKKISGFLKKGLSENGYSVDTTESGTTAESLASASSYDLIILDAILSDQNGFDTVRHLRSDGYEGPILMLAALTSTKDKVHGLDAGADDYLTTPFEFEELLARIRALLRRQKTGISSILRFEDIEMDLVSRRVKRGNHEVSLTSKEFSLLEYFMRNPGRPLSRTQISEHVWDIHFDHESNVVDVYMNLLRKKIDHPFKRKLLHTVIGAGYALRND
jgi:two-component system, OmpR family, copper resistance phosphate regulon response regulator CusR